MTIKEYIDKNKDLIEYCINGPRPKGLSGRMKDPYPRPSRKGVWWTPRYDRRRAIARGIQEMFYRTKFDWVKKMVDELYADPESYESISEKYNIELDVETDEAVQKYGPSIKLISGAGYKNNIILELSQKTVLMLKVDDTTLKEALCIEIVDCLTHEDTHRQQEEAGTYKESYVSGEEDKDAYYAYARQIACQLERIYNLPKSKFDIDDKNTLEIIEKLFDDETIISHLPSDSQENIKRYRGPGGKEWRKFLEGIYEYFIEPENPPISR
jgi:hypothetical protein